MTSTHPELAEITIKAAQWLADTLVAGGPFERPIIGSLRKRFGLNQVQACQAVITAAYDIAVADGMSHQQACHASMLALVGASLTHD